jgi:hypothetical protein
MLVVDGDGLPLGFHIHPRRWVVCPPPNSRMQSSIGRQARRSDTSSAHGAGLFRLWRAHLQESQRAHAHLCHCATVPLCHCATVPLCHCANCGLILDRDANAALNILRAGQARQAPTWPDGGERSLRSPRL